jgi:hypothetical protein
VPEVRKTVGRIVGLRIQAVAWDFKNARSWNGKVSLERQLQLFMPFCL